MPEVINVKFRNRGKAYCFAPGELTPAEGDQVVVETSKGLEIGQCVEGVHEVEEGKLVSPLRPVVRIATAEDLRIAEQNRKKEAAAFAVCEERIKAHGLDMKLVDVEYAFEGGKILFFFTADGRVDFRELVKDLASRFHTRIELRQIGVRDGAKMLGGLGICGRPFCCTTFLEDFQPVSIRMAKTQNLSLNPTKISGTCGRLMCCLKYEQEAYEHLIKTLPKADAAVDTPKGKGTVAEVNLLRRTVKVRLADQSDTSLQTYPVDRLGYTLNGEYIEPKPEEKAPVVSDLPDLSLYTADQGRLGSRVAAALEGKLGEKPGGKNGERSGEKKNNGKNRSRSRNHGGKDRGDKPPEGERKKTAAPQNRSQKSHVQPPPAEGSVKTQASGEKAEGKKSNYHRRYFHRGKKPGGSGGGGKSE